MKYFACLFFLLFAICCQAQQPAKAVLPKAIVEVEYPEVYELANIVLALTEYGKTDEWQVQKDFAYYDEMRTYFKPFENHPLLDSVNFSKERWKEYLSFRTDAYAFSFNADNKLQRNNKFYAFEIKTFDQNLALVEDFAKVSNFRAFFQAHQSYYQQVVENYKQTYMIAEMMTFLSDNFESNFTKKRYVVVISPFVLAQNLHRNIDKNWTADFPNVAKSIVTLSGDMSVGQKSAELHTLFTEMDHGFVNPASKKHKVKKRFNERKWDNNSGYGKSNGAVFNEYMTWAVFDLFNKKHFPEMANEINQYWHFQNETRGFMYSELFANHLMELYNQNKGAKRIEDLYPEMLDWCEAIEPTLSKPVLVMLNDTIAWTNATQQFEFQFSAPMQEVDSFQILVVATGTNTDTVTIGPSNQLVWKDNGTKLSFVLSTTKAKDYRLIFNWWGTKLALRSKKGIMLKALTKVYVH